MVLDDVRPSAQAGKDGQKDHGEHEMSEWIAVLRHCLKRYQQGESSSTEPVASALSADRSMARIDSVVEDSQPDSSDRATAQVGRSPVCAACGAHRTSERVQCIVACVGRSTVSGVQLLAAGTSDLVERSLPPST